LFIAQHKARYIGYFQHEGRPFKDLLTNFLGTVNDVRFSPKGDLLAAADIVPYEAVDIWDCTSGARLRTYAIPGEAGSGEICVNGAAAHLIKPHDLVIIASWTEVDDAEARTWEAKRVFVDGHNRIRD